MVRVAGAPSAWPRQVTARASAAPDHPQGSRLRPAAAALMGWFTAHRDRPALFWLGPVTAMVAIHAGGIAQLAVLSAGLASAVRLGSLPFLLADAIKALVAGVIVWRFGARLLPRA